MTSTETAAAALEHMEAVAEAAVIAAGDKIRKNVTLTELRTLLGQVLTREQQDAALRGLGMGQLVYVDVAETEVRVRAHLAPESSRRRNTPEYEQAAYGLGTQQRADLIYLEPVDA